MHLTAILAAGLLSATTLVSAEWEIVTTTWHVSTSFKDVDSATKWEAKKASEISKAWSTYATHLTADPQYASFTKVVHDELATATDVPKAVLESGTTTTYTTVPAWFTRLPNDAQKYYNSVIAAEISIAQSVAEAGAAKPTPGPIARMGVYGAAAGVAALGAAGGMLM